MNLEYKVLQGLLICISSSEKAYFIPSHVKLIFFITYSDVSFPNLKYLLVVTVSASYKSGILKNIYTVRIA